MTTTATPANAFYATSGGRGYPLANILSTFAVRDAMSTDVEWVKDNDTCDFAAQKMLQRNVGALPVQNFSTALLLGIITDRDIVRRVLAQGHNPASVLVGQAMTASPITIYEDVNLTEAERQMIQRQVRRLLVLRRADNQVIGIISVDDIAMYASRVRAGEILRGTAAPATASGTVPNVVVSKDAPGLSVTTTSDVSRPGDVRESVYNVDEVMNRNIECVPDTMSCLDAARTMANRNIGFLPIATAGSPGQLCGVITDRDLLLRMVGQSRNPANISVRDIMTKEVCVAFTDDNLADAETLMMNKRVRRVPVVFRGTNQLAGIVSVDDIAVVASRQRAGAIVEEVARPSAPLEAPAPTQA